MNEKQASMIVEGLRKKRGCTLTIEEAKNMQKVPSDSYNMYVTQKGDVTFLAWVSQDNVIVKTVAW